MAITSNTHFIACSKCTTSDTIEPNMVHCPHLDKYNKHDETVSPSAECFKKELICWKCKGKSSFEDLLLIK